MKKLEMPNLRKMLVPDPDMILIDVDIKGADARVVAWEADDEPLKDAFRKDLDIHAFNAESIFKIGAPLAEYKKSHHLKPLRHKAKTGVHAVDYGCKERTLAQHLGITTHEAAKFIRDWFREHPGIEAWHRRVEHSLLTQNKVSNIWGFTRPYFDRADNLLPAALAWIGQSTTAIAIDRLMVQLDAEMSNEIQILLQTHDSCTFQTPIAYLSSRWSRIVKACKVTAPYPDPLEFPIEIAISENSWGDVYEVREDMYDAG